MRVSACCIMNDAAADCDGGLTFHSQLPLRVKNDSLCPLSRLGYYHPPAYMSQSPAAISLSAISHTLYSGSLILCYFSFICYTSEFTTGVFLDFGVFLAVILFQESLIVPL